MERNDIAKKIREIIDNLLVVTIDKEVPETSKLVDDLQMDDLDRVELIMSIEEAFNLDIREEYDTFNTIEELINYVNSHVDIPKDTETPVDVVNENTDTDTPSEEKAE